MVNRMQAGEQLGNYRLVRRLGVGGFAEVYLGEHRYLKRQVAIKVLLVELSGDDKESERFLSEAQTMAALKHPHIIGCLDFGIERNIPYIVMDYAPGGTLRDLHPEGDLVPLDTVVGYIEQVAEALQYAHDQGIMHLDVKPENMLLGQSGEILLSDFGLARFTQSVSKRVTSLIGTASYMAPEYLQRKPQPASDQYSLAIVTYEWLAGMRPFDGDDERIVIGQQLQSPPPPLRDFIPTLPAAVDEVIRAALAKKPEERYPSLRAFAEALALASHSSRQEDTGGLLPVKPETLYREGLKAKGEGKLELAKQLLEELQSRAPAFRSDVVGGQLQQIGAALRPQWLARYRAEAEAANQAGQWEQEIDAWEAMLQLDPPRTEAQEARTRIRLAQEHQLHDHLYQDAAQLVAEDNRAGAQQLLQQLYAEDAYYGDPQGLARKVRKVSVPLTYQQEQAARRKEEARQDRRDEAEARHEDRRDFAREAYGAQLGKLWLIWLAWFAFLLGVGATVGALTQSWPWSLLALVAVSVASWGLGYRKALAAGPLAVLCASSLALALWLTLSLAHLNYTHPLASPYTDTISTGFFTSKDVTRYHYLYLGRQLRFGLISGAVMALAGVLVAFFFRPPYGKRHQEEPSFSLSRGNSSRISSSRLARRSTPGPFLSVANLIWIAFGAGAVGFVCWLIVASIAPTNDWGFGFDLGAHLAWLGLAFGCLLGIGVGASLPIWWTAMRQWGRRRW